MCVRIYPSEICVLVNLLEPEAVSIHIMVTATLLVWSHLLNCSTMKLCPFCLLLVGFTLKLTLVIHWFFFLLFVYCFFFFLINCCAASAYWSTVFTCEPCVPIEVFDEILSYSTCFKGSVLGHVRSAIGPHKTIFKKKKCFEDTR